MVIKTDYSPGDKVTYQYQYRYKIYRELEGVVEEVACSAKLNDKGEIVHARPVYRVRFGDRIMVLNEMFIKAVKCQKETRYGP